MRCRCDYLWIKLILSCSYFFFQLNFSFSLFLCTFEFFLFHSNFHYSSGSFKMSFKKRKVCVGSSKKITKTEEGWIACGVLLLLCTTMLQEKKELAAMIAITPFGKGQWKRKVWVVGLRKRANGDRLCIHHQNLIIWIFGCVILHFFVISTLGRFYSSFNVFSLEMMLLMRRWKSAVKFCFFLDGDVNNDRLLGSLLHHKLVAFLLVSVEPL